MPAGPDYDKQQGTGLRVAELAFLTTERTEEKQGHGLQLKGEPRSPRLVMRGAPS